MSPIVRSAWLASPWVVALVVSACAHPELPALGNSSASPGNVTSTNPNLGTGPSGTGGPGSSGNGGPGASGGTPSGEGPPTVVFNGDMMDVGGPPATVEVCEAIPYVDKFTPGQQVPPPPSDQEVQAIVSQMALPDRIKQLIGIDAPAQGAEDYNDIERSQDVTLLDGTRIRGYLYRDAGRGVNLAAGQPGRAAGADTATVFPTASERGASFDLDLEYRIGEAIADETVASGNTMLLAPCMNILRHPYWGRAQETYGEDSFHLGRMASALTGGLQTNVTACAKHFAANNIENGRATANAQMDEQTLREVYGRHFEMVVRDGGVGCIMASYNLVNSVKSTQNRHLLTDILRTDFGFQGLVITDWWAMPGDQARPSQATARDNAKTAMQAGLDLEVPWALNYGQLNALVSAGELTTAQIDAAAARVVKQKARFHALYSNQSIGLKAPVTRLVQGSIAGNDEHIALAHEAALKGMVLLKNDNATLPIKTDGSVRTVAVIGPQRAYRLQSTTAQPGTQVASAINFPVDVNLGDRGSSRVNPEPGKSIGPSAGFTQVGGSHGINIVTGNTVAAVGNADFVVLIIGLTPGDEGEEYAIPAGGDRASLTLPDNQDALVTQVAALGKPMAVVLETGSIVNMPWLDQVPSVVMAWYSGQQGGLAMAELLFGDANFSGRMPLAWPNERDLPPFKSGTTTVMDYFLGYRYQDQQEITPIFPYGHGLSYSTFTYSNLQLGCGSADKGAVIPVTVDVKNDSPVAGEEVVFAFVSFPATTARRSVKELKGFKKVPLAAGETKSVTIPIRVQDLKYWQGDENGQWLIESGPVRIMVGKSAAPADLTLQGTVNVL